MTAGIVHDFGNVIQILSSAMRILDGHPDVRGAHRLRPVIAGATTSLEGATALVRQLLGFARDSDLDVEHEEVDVEACLEELIRALRWIAADDIELDLRIAAAPSPRVTCNRRKFENALLNLVLNARDAMPSGGTMTISVAISSLYGQATKVFVSVADTGQGMTPEILARAFEPFFTTKTDGRSNGLGLAMVRHFAEEAGGAVAIRSQLGVGTMVTMQLPLSRAASTRASA